MGFTPAANTRKTRKILMRANLCNNTKMAHKCTTRPRERSRLAAVLDSRDGRGRRRGAPRHKETRRERHHKYPCSLNFLLSRPSRRVHIRLAAVRH